MKKMLSNLQNRLFRLSEDEPLSPLSVLVLIKSIFFTGKELSKNGFGAEIA